MRTRTSAAGSRPTPRSRLLARVRCKRAIGFTLLELMVVVTLMAVAVGLTVFRLDGLTETSRLRSGAAQLDALLRLTTTQARTSGQPRRVEYLRERDRVVVHAPRREGERWRWDEGAEYRIGTGIQVHRVLREGDGDMEAEKGDHTVRIGADGRCPAHAVILKLHDRYAVILLGGPGGVRESGEAGGARLVLLEARPQATRYEHLLIELEAVSDAR